MDILHLVPIKTDPAALFDAITTEEGLSSWWTKTVEAKPEQDSIAEFRFEEGKVVFRMQVSRLEPDEVVEWRVLDPAPPEWEGTRVTWQLEREGEGVNLLFGHRDWKTTEGSFPAINFNWAYYLLSLTDYLERGRGFPHPEPRVG